MTHQTNSIQKLIVEIRYVKPTTMPKKITVKLKNSILSSPLARSIHIAPAQYTQVHVGFNEARGLPQKWAVAYITSEF